MKHDVDRDNSMSSLRGLNFCMCLLLIGGTTLSIFIAILTDYEIQRVAATLGDYGMDNHSIQSLFFFVEQGVLVGIVSLASIFLLWLFSWRNLMRDITTLRHLVDESLEEAHVAAQHDVNYEEFSELYHDIMRLFTQMIIFEAELKDTCEKQREAEEGLVEMEQHGKDKEAFVATLSHEMRTPLNGMIGILELLGRGNLSDQQSSYVDLASTSAQSLLELVNDFLDYARLEARPDEVVAVEFNLVRLLESVVTIISSSNLMNDVELVLDLSELEHEWVYSDAVKLRQITTNLFSNGLKYTQSGHVVLKASSKCSVDGQIHLSITVSDSGVGIPERDLETVFAPFARSSNNSGGKVKSTGLGLAIVKRLCDALGGVIRVRSKVGCGTTFMVDISVGQSYKMHSEDSSQWLQGKKYLVVDDEAVASDVLKRQLSRWGANVVHCTDTENFIDNLEKRVNGIDAVFVDVDRVFTGRGRNGVLRQLANKVCASKLVLMVPVVDEEVRAKYDVGSDFIYCGKPFMPSTLKISIENLEVRRSEVGVVRESDVTRSSYVVNDLDELSENADGVVKEDSVGKSAPNILVVDDNPVNIVIITSLLKKIGYHCSSASDGEQAIKRLVSDNSFDLVFMDARMPGLDGCETVSRIREHAGIVDSCGLPIIALTADNSIEEKNRCLKSGMNDFLTKPVSVKTLQETVELWSQKSGNNGVKPFNRSFGQRDI